MWRRFYYSLFVFFALVAPLLVFNSRFPFATFMDMSSQFQFSVAGLFAMLIIVLFFRKQLSDWVKGFDRVTWLRGLFMWIMFVTPVGIGYALLMLTKSYSEDFTYILGWTFISHLIGGLFKVFAANEKAKDFKKWVLK
jgi:hypothetical protein